MAEDIQNNNHHPLPPSAPTHSFITGEQRAPERQKLKATPIRQTSHPTLQTICQMGTLNNHFPIPSTASTQGWKKALCEWEPLQYYSLDNQSVSQTGTHGELYLGQFWHYIYPAFSAGISVCTTLAIHTVPDSHSTSSNPLNIQFKLNIWSLAVGFHSDAVLIEFETWFSNISQGSKTVNWRRERVVIKPSRLVALRLSAVWIDNYLYVSPLSQYED